MTKIRICFIIALILSGCLYVNAYSNTELSETEKGEIEQDVQYKINDFISYLPEIAATNHKSIEQRKTAKRYKERALKLFIGEGKAYPYLDINNNERMHDPVTMQTTSRGKKNRPQPLVRYLDRLMALPYHKVEVDTCQAVRLTKDIHKIGENRWSCTAYFIQTFKAYNREGYCILNDKDPKKVTIYIDREEVYDPIKGEVKVFYIVQLGDISIYSDYNYQQ